MSNHYVVVRFKHKKEFKIYEAANAEEVTIGNIKVLRSKNPQAPFQGIDVLKIQNEGRTIKILPLEGIDDWALFTSET